MAASKIKVLWVEDDLEIVDAYQRQAARFNLYLEHCPYWEIAEDKLISEFDTWQAIILDAKCPLQSTNVDEADVFLANAIDRIRDICSERRRSIPWYVLSGDAERDISRIIPPSRLKWDSDWDKKVGRPFYSKLKEILYEDNIIPESEYLLVHIKDQVINYNSELNLRYNHYPDVFKALSRLVEKGVNKEVEQYLINLLSPIHFKNVDKKEYNRRYGLLRLMIEHIFRHMCDEMRLLPTIVKNKGKLTLSWCSSFLGGEFDDKGHPKSDLPMWKKVVRNTEKNSRILPKQLAEYLKLAIQESGAALHTSDEESGKMNFEKYIVAVDYSPYRLQSLALASCDFILWYDKFLNEHPDVKTNSKEFWTIKERNFE